MAAKETSDYEDLLERLDRRIPFMAMNPCNESSEKKKFLRDSSHSPYFSYAKKRCGCEDLMKQIKRIKLADTAINCIIEEKFSEINKLLQMNKAVGNDGFSRHSVDIFGKPSPELIRKARIILKKETSRPANKVSSADVVREMRSIVSELGLSGWKVSEKSMAANAAVRACDRMIYIKKGSLFCDDFVRRIAAHEIGAHVFRSENGMRQPYRLFFIGFPGYLTTEEGIAVNCEEMAGCSMDKTLKDYAGRVLAVDLALKGSFRDVFDGLREYFDEEDSWKLALRAKRGVGDSPRPGAYTKDFVYLQGYLKVKDFLEQNGSKGMNMLYHGKIGLEHLKLMDKIEGLVEPRLVPSKGCFAKF